MIVLSQISLLLGNFEWFIIFELSWAVSQPGSRRDSDSKKD